MGEVKTTPTFEGYYGLESVVNSASGVVTDQQPYSMVLPKTTATDGGESSSISGGTKYSPRKKSEEASFKHAMAERKRRKQINAHYDTLRRLFPHLPKRDKPTVLTETVRHVKELRKKVAEYMAASQQQHGDQGCCCGTTNGSRSLFIPGERDEVMVNTAANYNEKDEEIRMVKALICCDDRPGLHKDLSEAVRSVKAQLLKAEMATIGGRTKAEVVLKWCKDGGGEEDVIALTRALKAVIQNRAFPSPLLFAPTLSDSKWAPLGLQCHLENGRTK